MSTLWLCLKSLLYTLIVPGLVVGWLPLRWLHRGTRLPVEWTGWQWGALPLLLTGLLTYLTCLWYLVVTGRGTPAPIDPPKRLVQRGPYRWVRHPMYLGLLLLVLGEAVFFHSLTLFLYAVCLASVFQIIVVGWEERSLQRRFGAMYSDYCHLAPRWLPRKPRLRLETVPPFPTNRQ